MWLVKARHLNPLSMMSKYMTLDILSVYKLANEENNHTTSKRKN